jgi:TonB-linked SusC/RagA family outer membrane protein
MGNAFSIHKNCVAQDVSKNPIIINTKGKITDEAGNPVLASINVKATRISTATNTKGEFELFKINDNSILVISGVGIEKKEIDVAGRTDIGSIFIKIKFTEGSEVIVEANTGYQKLSPNELNGSVVVIDNKTLNQQVGTNILKRLDGVTSGLAFTNKRNNNPQSDLNISIRGLSTVNGPLDPVIVIDNFIYEGSIANINPNDVESISVLKDASATSIYGARGGNGVIVITTKKGRFNQPVKIEFNSSLIIVDKPNLFSVPQISSSDYIDVEQFLYQKGYYNSLINFAWFYRRPFSPALQTFIQKTNGTITAQDSAMRINELKQFDVRNDYNKYFYTNAFTQQYALNVRGGSASNTYTFSVNYDRNNGALHEQFNKLNINLQNFYQPHKKVQINLGAYYTNSNSKSGRPASVQFDSKPLPYLQLADKDGNALPISIYHPSYTDTAAMKKLHDWNYYPLEDYRHNILKTNVEDIIANVGVNYNIINGLDFDIRYQYQRQNTTTERIADVESFYTRDLINRFTQVDYSTGNIKYVVPNNAIQIRYNNINTSQNLRTQINFIKKWNNHSVNSISGFEIREIIRKGFSNTVYGYNQDPLTTARVDFINQYRTLPQGSLSSIPGSPSLSLLTNRFVSAYANASYIFKGKYQLSGSSRKDGANILGVATNDRWKPLWSVGLGWEISRENFYKSKTIPFLRVRTTYGASGNLDISKTALPVAAYATNSVTNLPYTQISTLNNPHLQWEEIRQMNLAIDFRLKKEILNGTLEFYTKKGDQLYGLANYDYTTWGFAQQITKNVAAMSGKGIDARITSRIINKKLKWYSELLFNYNDNKVTRYYSTDAVLGIGLLSSGTTITPVVGKPLYAIAAYKWGGLNSQGDPQGYLNNEKSTDYESILNLTNTEGIKNNQSIVYIGSATPLFFGSLINTFTWGKFSTSINISYKMGYYFKKPTLSYSTLFSSGIGTNDFSKRWIKPGDELITTVPALVYTNYPQFSSREDFYSNAEIHVLKADHFRLQYVNFNYLLKEPNTSSKISLRIYGNISNLGILWRANKENIDPDFPYSIPTVRSYAIGLQATF